MENLLSITAVNTYEIYKLIEWLRGCLVKKIAKGITPSVDYLAECSTVKTIIREAKKQHINCGGSVWWDRNYEREARREVSKMIIDEINE